MDPLVDIDQTVCRHPTFFHNPCIRSRILLIEARNLNTDIMRAFHLKLYFLRYIAEPYPFAATSIIIMILCTILYKIKYKFNIVINIQIIKIAIKNF